MNNNFMFFVHICVLYLIFIFVRYHVANQLPEVPKIFNYVSGAESPIIYNDFFKEVWNNYREAPPLTSIWYYCVFFTDNVWAIIILRFLLHRIPAIFMDLSSMLIGKKPQ